jgi:hypothetical protein
VQKHTIYVPDHLAERARDIAIAHAGGATLSPGHQGYWQAPDGKLYVDEITLVTVIEPETAARDLIVTMLFDSDEQAVAYETNGTPNIVGAPHGE